MNLQPGPSGVVVTVARGAVGAVGSRTTNLAPPPGASSARIDPPWATTIADAIDSPKPARP